MPENFSYTPIDCDFYDELEALSTLRRNCEIAYVASEQTMATVQGRITNLYSWQGEEFLVVDDALEIRLDKLLSVNGKRLP